MDMESLFIIGRVSLGTLAIVAGLSHFFRIGSLGRMLKGLKIPFGRQLVFLTGVALILAGLGVAFWLYIEESLWFLMGFFVAVSLFVHRFWSKKGTERLTDMRLFLWNMMLAGLLVLTLAVL
jgi:uncharacterized membrane protein YphA (DoxX/SURF4 family)